MVLPAPVDKQSLRRPVETLLATSRGRRSQLRLYGLGNVRKRRSCLVQAEVHFDIHLDGDGLAVLAGGLELPSPDGFHCLLVQT